VQSLAGPMLYDFSTLRNENLSTLKVYDGSNSRNTTEVQKLDLLRRNMSGDLHNKASLNLKNEINSFRKNYTRGR
jgi:hypothetical protein